MELKIKVESDKVIVDIISKASLVINVDNNKKKFVACYNDVGLKSIHILCFLQTTLYLKR